MSTTPTNVAELQQQLAPLAYQAANLQAHIGQLQEELAHVKGKMRDIVGTAGPGTYGAGDHTVTIALNRRLDLAAVAKAYPPQQHPELYSLQPDSKLVRANLAPATVEDFMATVGDERVTVK